MNYEKRNTRSNRSASLGLLLAVTSSLFLFVGPQRAAAQQYYNSVSSFLDKSSMWRNNFYNDIIRANSGSFGKVSDAKRVTQQEIQNLCKPFPCVGDKSSIMSQPTPSAYPQAPTYVPPPPRQYPITSTDFRPVGGRLIPDQISRTAQGTSEEKEQIRTLSNQFLDALEREGRKNNMANSFAFLTSVSMEIVIGRELTDAEEQQLISGFNTSLASSPQFVSMSARDKQVLYESAIVSGGMIAFLYVQGKQNNDAKMQSDGQTMAKAVLVSLFGIRIE